MRHRAKPQVRSTIRFHTFATCLLGTMWNHTLAHSAILSGCVEVRPLFPACPPSVRFKTRCQTFSLFSFLFLVYFLSFYFCVPSLLSSVILFFTSYCCSSYDAALVCPLSPHWYLRLLTMPSVPLISGESGAPFWDTRNRWVFNIISTDVIHLTDFLAGLFLNLLWIRLYDMPMIHHCSRPMQRSTPMPPLAPWVHVCNQKFHRRHKASWCMPVLFLSSPWSC